MKSNKKTTDISFDIKIENWLTKNSTKAFTLLLVVFISFGFLYFNARASIAGDDSTYITRAINFWQDGTFPNYQGPLYPIVLSLFVGLFGANLVLLKISSTIFMVIFFIFFYKSLKNRVSYTILFFTLTILSISHYFLYFSSQTFSEPLFLALQSLLFLLVYKNQETSINKINFKSIKPFLLISLVIFGLYMTRTVGIGAILAVSIFYLIKKQFKQFTIILAGFLILTFSFIAIKSTVWGIELEKGEQTTQLLNKHPYDSKQGKEDFKGFITRFKDNSNLYLSKHFIRFVGFKSNTKNTTNGFVTILLYAVFLFGVIHFFNKKREMLFMAIYLALMLGITFFSLQKLWDQYRLIIPFVPFMIIYLLSTIENISKRKNNMLLSKGIPVIMLMSIIFTLSAGVKNIDIKTLTKNINGDKLAGFTEDWVNYIKAVEYSEKNLAPDSYVACRKPNIARIYGKGKKFYGIYRISSEDPDELMQELKDKKVTHIIVASLRKNPNINTGETINTIRRYINVIVSKYPKSFILVQQFGKSEPSYIFKINYDTEESLKNNLSKE